MQTNKKQKPTYVCSALACFFCTALIILKRKWVLRLNYIDSDPEKTRWAAYSEVNHSSRQDHCPIPMVRHCHLTPLTISKKMLYNANRCLGILSSQIQGQNYSSVQKILINRGVPIFLHDPHIWKSELREHGVSTNHGLSRESWMKIFFSDKSWKVVSYILVTFDIVLNNEEPNPEIPSKESFKNIFQLH